ncbi:potassium/proton antiporter [Marinoscillum sp. 108]|uniref:potassium/proton antiporter n=1 Tax=Marinoscillum sp. 108 TaxID=2653151 RepID=UPI0012F46E3F|nr:potassium/proton antiporter [Marinoscillum sp. 108]VXD11220.1 K(+)/H(+) antiporter NhaP2 [Marinoscillum sp. 108]
MNITIENIILIGSVLLLISIIAGKTSYRFGIPTLLLFLTIGMLAGSDGIGGIYFDNPQIAQFIGVVSLNFILFSGGLDTSWQSVKPVLKEGIALSTLGVLLTAIGLGYFVYLITDFSLYESLLLGAIVSSTDAAAVFSILRGRNLALKKNLRPTLELESGSNDPMAYVLTIAFLSLVQEPEQSIFSIIPLLFLQMSIGGVAGFLFGKLSKIVINKIKLDYEGLYPVLTIALMFITFSATDAIGGNGFLAIYICSVYLGNQNLIHKKTIMRMFDGLAWLMQIVLFLTLGLLVFPSQIIPFIGVGLLISIFLILVARPLAVFIALIPFKMRLKRRFYISWVGLRGAVPIVFATYPLLAGIDKSHAIFNIVFFVSISSVLVQGTTLSIVAKWLNVGLPEKAKPLSPTDQLMVEHPKTLMKEIVVEENSTAIGLKIVDLKFPKNAIIAMIEREGNYLTPNGSTELMARDKLVVLTDKKDVLNEVYTSLRMDKS